MSDSLGSSVRYPVSLVSGSFCYNTAMMPVGIGLTRETQSLIHELRMEYVDRVRDVKHTEEIWKKRTIPNDELTRQINEINKDIRERLEKLVGFDIDPDPLSGGLGCAFANTLKGYRAPSRSRSRSPSRWQHPHNHKKDLEAL
jgi:hypothetical protein